MSVINDIEFYTRLNASSVLKIKTVHETVQDFKQDIGKFYQILENHDDKLFQYMNAHIGNVIGAGGMGTIYELNGVFKGKYILKVTQLCYNRNRGLPENPAVKELCTMVNSNDMTYILPGGNEHTATYFMPNYLSETITLYYMNELVVKDISPSFPKIYDTFYQNIPDKPFSTIMEALKPFYDSIKTKYDLYIALFYIFHALHTGQIYNKFNHYDFHCDNVMTRENDPANVQIFPLYDGTYVYIKGTSRLPVIIDFGFSRFNKRHSPTQTINIIPRYSQAQAEIPGGSSMNYYFFNKYIDGMSLYGSLSVYRGTRNDMDTYQVSANSMAKNINKVWTRDVDAKVLGILVDVNHNDIPKLTQVRKDLFGWKTGVWRPNPAVINNNFDIKFQTPLNVARKFLKLASAEGNINSNNNMDEILRNSVSIKIHKNPNYLSHQNVPHTIYKKLSPTDPLDYSLKLPSRMERRIVSTYKNTWLNVEVLTKKDMNIFRTLNEPMHGYTNCTDANCQKIINNCVATDQYITIAYIDTTKAYAAGYVFKNDCCKLDAFDYMSENSGVSINSTFFNFKGTDKHYVPIGNFKNDYYNTQHERPKPIPADYNSEFPAVIVDSKVGQVAIVDWNDSYTGDTQIDMLFRASPYLVKNGVKVFTKNKFNETYPFSDTYKWRCDPSIPDTRRVVSENEGSRNNRTGQCEFINKPNNNNNKNIRACSSVNAGEAIHAANPNPRSAFVIRTANAQLDGRGDIAFVYVEGRGMRGEGVDLRQLGDICTVIGAETAINLDGGGSSSLLWREDNGKIIYSTNPENLKTYPVGSFFGLIKRDM